MSIDGRCSVSIVGAATYDMHSEVGGAAPIHSRGLSRGRMLTEMLGWVAGALQRPEPSLSLRAAAVAKDGAAVLLAGPPRSGVTSLAAWMMEQDFSYVSDGETWWSSRGVAGFPAPLHLPAATSKHIAELDRLGTAAFAIAGDRAYFSIAKRWSEEGPLPLHLLLFPRFEAHGPLGLKQLSAFDAALKLLALVPGATEPKDRDVRSIIKLVTNVPALEVTFGDFIDLGGVVDRLSEFTLREKLSPGAFGRFFGGFARPVPARRHAIPAASPIKPARRFTIGMATYDDYDGVYFSLQSIRLHHKEILDEVEFIIIDNRPDGPCGAALKDLEKYIPNLRYVPVTDVSGTAPSKGRIFREASGDFVVCMDCHVLFEPGSLKRLFDYFRAEPDTPDLLQGPMVTDNLEKLLTHFEPVWSHGMYGRFAYDPAGDDPDGPPFDIPMQGLGVFACRRTAWVGFNPAFRGFGGEEGYLHEKFRQAGGRTLCLPFLRWLHRFGRPLGVPYPINWHDRFHNYFVGFREIGWPTAEMETYMVDLLGRTAATRLLAKLGHELDGRSLAVAENGEDPAPALRISVPSPFPQLEADALAEHLCRFAAVTSVLGVGTDTLLQLALARHGARFHVPRNDQPEEQRHDLAISFGVMPAGFSSQMKRHVAGLAQASDTVFFVPPPADGGRRAHWREIFARRGFRAVELFHEGLASDPRLREHVKAGAELFQMEMVPLRPRKLRPAKPEPLGDPVSVVLPVHNGANFLTEAIASILVQSHRNFEFIVVDDGSTDDTLQIAQNFAAVDARVRVITQANGGEPRAANAGFAAAKHALVARMDHDDIALPERLERQLAYMLRHPGIAVVGSYAQPIDEEGQSKRDLLEYPVTVAACKSIINDSLVAPINNPSAMIRREVFQELQGYRPQFRYAADLDFWLRLSEKHDMANLPEVLLGYRLHGKNLTVQRNFEQLLHAHLAKHAARFRSRQEPEPAMESDELALADITRFSLSDEELLGVLRDLFMSALGGSRIKGKSKSSLHKAIACLNWARRIADKEKQTKQIQ